MQNRFRSGPTGAPRPPISLGRLEIIDRKKLCLPEEFLVVPELCRPAKVKVAASSIHPISIPFSRLQIERKKEHRWLDSAMSMLSKLSDDLQKSDHICWAAHHSFLQPEPTHLPANIGVLPMFREKAATFSMVKHGMIVISNSIKFVNPGQIPVMQVDQPIFAIAMEVQWTYNEILGEDKFVVTFGRLHLEKAFLSVLGDLLEGSGWENVITQAEIATSGTANSFLSATNITRTRNAHQVTLVALVELRKQAYEKSSAFDIGMSMDDWIQEQEPVFETFAVWNIVIGLQLDFFIFIRSLREGDYLLELLMLETLVFLFFILVFELKTHTRTHTHTFFNS
eukprot:Lithocolla_globosa_v1_NODE_5933_length_1161_cov_5.328210.p1 type:complete len:339 gc:universal NODE_5933_length_1161_cov_5.328210:1076-60(-)